MLQGIPNKRSDQGAHKLKEHIKTLKAPGPQKSGVDGYKLRVCVDALCWPGLPSGQSQSQLSAAHPLCIPR